MHAATVFYGYIIYKVDNKILRIALLFLLCCFGFSLIQCRFHDLFDVVGAAAFAFVEILLYRFILSILGEKIVAVLTIIASLLLVTVLSLFYKSPWHVWLAFYALIGTILSLSFIEDKKNCSLPQKFLSLALSALLVAIVHFAFKIYDYSEPFISTIKFAILPAIAMGSINLCSRVRFRTTAVDP